MVCSFFLHPFSFIVRCWFRNQTPRNQKTSSESYFVNIWKSFVDRTVWGECSNRKERPTSGHHPLPLPASNTTCPLPSLWSVLLVPTSNQSIIYFVQQPILRLPKNKRFLVTNHYNIGHNIQWLDVKHNYSSSVRRVGPKNPSSSKWD